MLFGKCGLVWIIFSGRVMSIRMRKVLSRYFFRGGFVVNVVQADIPFAIYETECSLSKRAITHTRLINAKPSQGNNSN